MLSPLPKDTAPPQLHIYDIQKNNCPTLPTQASTDWYINQKDLI